MMFDFFDSLSEFNRLTTLLSMCEAGIACCAICPFEENKDRIDCELALFNKICGTAKRYEKENIELRRIASHNEELCDNCGNRNTDCPAVAECDVMCGESPKCNGCPCATCKDGKNWGMLDD